jgi:hypothetical protein
MWLTAILNCCASPCQRSLAVLMYGASNSLYTYMNDELPIRWMTLREDALAECRRCMTCIRCLTRLGGHFAMPTIVYLHGTAGLGFPLV